MQYVLISVFMVLRFGVFSLMHLSQLIRCRDSFIMYVLNNFLLKLVQFTRTVIKEAR